MKKLIFTIFMGVLSGLNIANAQELQIVAQTGSKLTNLNQAQQDSLILAFPKFTAGTVIFENMSQAKADLNYNYYNQQVLFLEKGEIKKMDNLKDVVMITVGKRIFIPVSPGLGEVLIDDEVCLIESRKINVQEVKTGAYGSGGATASISNLQGVNGSNTSGSAYQHSFGTNASFFIDMRFFLMKDMKTYIANKKNFLKCFSACSEFVEKYITDHKPDYTDASQMRTFVALCNAQLKATKK
ncbi:MAG: hypothetical protein RR190_00715 [Bacteroidales bacterium]